MTITIFVKTTKKYEATYPRSLMELPIAFWSMNPGEDPGTTFLAK